MLQSPAPRRGRGFALIATTTVALTTTAHAGPCNPTTDGGGDTFANPVDLTAPLPIERCGNTCDNTNTIEDDCNGNSTGNRRDEWWSLTITEDDRNYDFSLGGHSGAVTEFDAKLYVFDTQLNLVGCDVGGCEGATDTFAPEIECLQLNAGTYFVVVDGFATLSDCGDYYLSITECLNCDNDLPIPGGPTQNELEDCTTGLPTNDGCNANGETEPLTPGVTVLGTARFDGTSRDTDWYTFSVNQLDNQAYTWTVDATFPALIGLAEAFPAGTPDCAGGTGVISPSTLGSLDDNCAQLSIRTKCLPGRHFQGAAEYRFFVAPQFAFVTDCTAGGRNAYQATLDVVDVGCFLFPCELHFCDCADRQETQNICQTNLESGVACVNGQPEGQYSSDNIFARVYTSPDERLVTCVLFGIVQSALDNARLDVRIKTLSVDTDPPSLANVTATLATVDVFVPVECFDTVVQTPISPPLPVSAGDTFLVEMFWDATTQGIDPVGAIFPLGNQLGQTRPVYILSNGCGLPDYIALSDVGFDDAVLIDYAADIISSPCFADMGGGCSDDKDGDVDARDFLHLLAEYGSPCMPTSGDTCTADITDGITPGTPDGNVDALDLLLLLSEWGSPCNPAP